MFYHDIIPNIECYHNTTTAVVLIGQLLFHTCISTIPDYPNQCENSDCNTDTRQVPHPTISYVVSGILEPYGWLKSWVNCSPCVCRYGMHESFDYYLECRLRQQNQGLFTADRVRHNLLMSALPHSMWVSLFTGLDYWTGLLDWAFCH